MKLFWALIAVLVLASGGLLFMRGRGQDLGGGERVRASSLPEAATGTEPSEAAQSGAPTMPDGPQQAPPREEPKEEAAESPTEPGAWDAPQPETPAQEEPGADVEVAAADSPENGAVTGTDAETIEEAAESEAIADAEEAEGAGDAADVAIDAQEPSVELDTPETPEVEAEPGADTTAGAPERGAAPVRVENGVLVLNDLHRVPGEGTAESPYTVGWDTLVALEQEYDPKAPGKKDVPEWIKALDGKHVAITGFIAFPFIAPTADECMVMLNQWDGCCIGVPPTPYDAVEVKLADTLDVGRDVVNYGTITGVFRTDPYLVNGWLIGLYVMDEAVLSKAGGKNAPGF